jgi:ornithine cyclodeaminase/alanine dehydrogenase-like protein (mu-crystallin family)
VPLLWDLDAERARGVAERVGGRIASREEALGADVVVTVTPGKSVLFGDGSLREGQHVSLMGADGPGKAEVTVGELSRGRLFADDWEQASHGGELAAAVEAGTVSRADVTMLGDVLAGTADGRRSGAEITLFDSTGLAIQDLAIALAAVERLDELDLPRFEP